MASQNPGVATSVNQDLNECESSDAALNPYSLGADLPTPLLQPPTNRFASYAPTGEEEISALSSISSFNLQKISAHLPQVRNEELVNTVEWSEDGNDAYLEKEEDCGFKDSGIVTKTKGNVSCSEEEQAVHIPVGDQAPRSLQSVRS